MSAVLVPAVCPLHPEVRLVDEAGIARGLVRRRCPEAGCDYVTPSVKPERKRGRAVGRRGDGGRRWRRPVPVSSRWHLDPDERGA